MSSSFNCRRPWAMFAASLLALALASAAASASGPTDMKGAETPNGKVAMAWVDLNFNQHKPAEAFDLHVHKDYRNKYMGGPRIIENNHFEGQKAAEIRVFGLPQAEGLSFAFKKVIASEDFVMIQGLAKRTAKETGNMLWMLFRFKDGKIIEHWDIHGELPPNSDPELYY